MLRQLSRQFATILAGLVLVVAFQNCGPGFETMVSSLNAPLVAPPTPDNISQALKCDGNLLGTGTSGTRRLTKDELVATLTSIFGSDVMTKPAVVSSLALIPNQVVDDNSHFDNAITNVVGLESAAEVIVDAAFQDANKVKALLPNCSSSAVAACNDALVGSFGTKVYRRPLTEQEKSTTRAFSQKIAGMDGVKESIIRLLISPYFTQHIEVGEGGIGCTNNCPVVNGHIAKLTQFEVASRISYRLTGTMPDDALLQAAASQSLNSVAAVEAQAKRLLNTPQARQNWKRITRGWLGLAKVSDPANIVAQEAGISAMGFGEEALEEALRTSEYSVFDRAANFKTLMTDPVAFPYTDRLAKVYGTAKSSSAIGIPADRGGLLLKPAVLISGNTTSSPIHRGIFLLRKVMCGNIPDPNFAELNERNNEVDFSHVDLPNREYVTRLTSPSNCVGCHAIINPVGFALEKYGPLGVPRDVEVVYGPNGRLATHPIDTSVSDLYLGSIRTNVADAQDLINQVSQSEGARQCLSKAIVVNTGYREKSDADNCLINTMTSALVDGASVKDVLVRSVASEEIFWTSAKDMK